MNEQEKNTQNTPTANTENKFNSQNQKTETKNNFQNLNEKAKETNSADSKTGTDALNTESVKDTAKGIYDQAKTTAGQAYGVATQKAAEVVEEKKSGFADGLTSVAASIKQVGENLRENDNQNQITETAAKYGDTAAKQIEKVSAYFENKELREMMGDAERFARRNPAVFIGAAFGIGLLAARFLKSSPDNYKKAVKSKSFDSGQSSVNPS